ncbi:hypothetical protein MMC32_002948 [Xylographa parallela]|nr:hypothetical protein [Xylographa parallela]
MAPITEAHHHRSTTKALNKSFKSRHATKGLLKDLSKGKVEDRGKRNTKSLHQQVMSKIDRRHQARQKQQAKHQEHSKTTSIFGGQNGAPRIVAVVPLTEDGDSATAIQRLNAELDLEVDASSATVVTTRVDRFKQSLQYITVKRDLLSALDACKVADFVLFILSPMQEVDDTGELLIRAIEGQGVSTVFTVVQGLDQIDPPKRRSQVITSLKSYISHFFPNQEKLHSLDSRQDCSNIIRSLCTTTPKGVKWREDRSWMHVEEVQWPSASTENQPSMGEVVVTGVIRGKGLAANRLVQVGDWGTFQIQQITAASSSNPKKRKAEEMAIDDTCAPTVLGTPDADQDDLAELAPDDIAMGDGDDFPILEAPTERKGVLLDDHHYFSDDESHLPDLPKRLPRGTSAYQAAWFLGDVSDSGSDDEGVMNIDSDFTTDAPALPQDGVEGLDHRMMVEPTEGGPSEYPQSEMFLDPSPNEEADELAAYRSRKKTEAEEDLEFPDEIELLPNVLARERLARYRGLKSLRSSKWEMDEDRAYEPEDWNRLLQVADYKGAKSQAVREALVGGVPPGVRVHIHFRNVPLALQKDVSHGPLTLFSLLRHEHKRTVMNFSMTLSSDYPHPLKSKEELIMQCGPRRLVIHPLFSQTGNTPNNVHKFDRYLHPGRTAMATFIAPLTWGSVPTLFFKRTTPPGPLPPSSFDLIATGTSQPPDHSRVIAKRVILTGHPYKIHKKLVTVRYMFFNTEDVAWFKALQLWTKRGRSGYIKESLGTHGYFKATFDARINPQDSVGVSLYKRVFPRVARPWRGALEEREGEEGKEVEEAREVEMVV